MIDLYGKRTREYINFHNQILVPFGTPIPLHGVNPRNLISSVDWTHVRKETYEKYDYKCAICGESGLDQGYEHAVECHELMDYDFKNEIQYFNGLVALCPLCHKTIHWAQSSMARNQGTMTQDEYVELRQKQEKHLIKVNGKRTRSITRIKHYRWHDGNWKSNFENFSKLYPTIKIPTLIDTKYNGYFILNKENLFEKQKSKKLF